MVFKAHLQSVRVYLGSTKTIDRLCKSGESTVGLWDCGTVPNQKWKCWRQSCGSLSKTVVHIKVKNKWVNRPQTGLEMC